MAQAKKFLFDTAFAAKAERELAPKPQFTEEDLAAARAEGQQAGFQMGQESALRAIERRVADALDAVAAGLAGVDAAQARAAAELRADAARLALAIAGKLAPELVARQPLAEIEAMIVECLAQLPTEPRVVVRVAEGLVDALSGRIDDLVRRVGFSGAVVLLGEPTMAPGDARVEWADGGAERDFARTRRAVEEAVERYCRTETETRWAPVAETAEPEPAARARAGAASALDEDDPLADGLPALAR
jgi:flagellar assembly protein FliH